MLVSFFDPAARRIGLRSAFTLSMAALLIAHMPVVVGVGYAPWNLEVLASLGALASVACVGSVALRAWPSLLYAFVCFWVYWAIDAYLPDEAVMFWAPSAMALISVDFTVKQWSLLQATLPSAIVWILLISRWSENIRAMIAAFAAVWFVGLWMSDERQLLLPEEGRAEAPRVSNATPPTSMRAASIARTGFHSGDGRLRPVLHFILDEQASPRSLPATLPATIRASAAVTGSPEHPAHRMVDDYVARGFRYYSHVRSVSGLTQESLGALMGMGQEGVQYNLQSMNPRRFVHEIRRNRYIEELQTLGYRVNVVQNNFVRLCPAGTAARCNNYTFGTDGSMSSNIVADIDTRLAILLAAVNAAYSNEEAHAVALYRWVQEALQRHGIEPTYRWIFYGNPVAALNLTQQVGDSLRSIAPGEAYVVHLLLPHFPYMVEANCRVKPFGEWSAPNRHLSPGAAPLPEEQVYRDYWDQSACTHDRVMAMVDAAREHAELDPIVFVHGDHGSRVSGSFDDMSEQDPADVDMLETFLAIYTGNDVRGSAPSPGAEETALGSLPTLFARVFSEIRDVEVETDGND